MALPLHEPVLRPGPPPPATGVPLHEAVGQATWHIELTGMPFTTSGPQLGVGVTVEVLAAVGVFVGPAVEVVVCVGVFVGVLVRVLVARKKGVLVGVLVAVSVRVAVFVRVEVLVAAGRVPVIVGVVVAVGVLVLKYGVLTGVRVEVPKDVGVLVAASGATGGIARVGAAVAVRVFVALKKGVLTGV